MQAERQREADLRAEEARRDLSAEKKHCCIRHNTAAREYLNGLQEWTFAQRGGPAVPSDHFMTRRAEYRASYAEAQMVVSDAVLAEVRRRTVRRRPPRRPDPPADH